MPEVPALNCQNYFKKQNHSSIHSSRNKDTARALYGSKKKNLDIKQLIKQPKLNPASKAECENNDLDANPSEPEGTSNLAGALGASLPVSQALSGSDCHPHLKTTVPPSTNGPAGLAEIGEITRQLGLQGAGLEGLNVLSTFCVTSENTQAVNDKVRSQSMDGVTSQETGTETRAVENGP